jgi:hypothetical protein
LLNVHVGNSIIEEVDHSYNKEVTRGCPQPVEVGARPGLPLLKKVVNEVYLNQGKKSSYILNSPKFNPRSNFFVIALNILEFIQQISSLNKIL